MYLLKTEDGYLNVSTQNIEDGIYAYKENLITMIE